MKKLFWILVVLSLIGSGALLWLIKNRPKHDSMSEHAQSSEHVEDDHGGGHGEAHGDSHDDHGEVQGDGHGDEDMKNEEESSDIAHHDKKVEHAKKGDHATLKLVLKTEPAEADIYVDNEYYGKSPVELPLGENAKDLRVEKDSYTSIREIIPPASKAKTGDLHWNLSLDKQMAGIALLHGKQGPAFVQVRSLPVQDFESGDYGLGASPLDGLIGCKVNIKGKGVWVRILRGPYLMSFAKNMLKDTKEKYSSDAYIVGEQKCLK